MDMKGLGGAHPPPQKKPPSLNKINRKLFIQFYMSSVLSKHVFDILYRLINEKLHETTKGKNNWDIKTPLLQIL